MAISAQPAHARPTKIRPMACSRARAPASTPGPAACGPAARSSAPPRPGRNLGLGREFGLAPFPAWAAALAQLISAAHAERTVGLQYRWIKTSEHRRSLNPSPHSFSFSSPHSSPSVSHRATQTDGESVEPWRRRRPPRRRARSPVGERAAVERPGRGASVACSGEQFTLGRPFLFPAWWRARRRGKLSGFPSSPFPLLYFSFLLGSDPIWGRGLELGLGFEYFSKLKTPSFPVSSPD